MNIPWLQVTTGFLRTVSKDLGNLLGVSRGDALALTMDLWDAITTRINVEAPDLDAELLEASLIPNPHAEARLADLCNWSGDVDQLAAALCHRNVRAVEKVANGYRVRGMDRYVEASKKQNRKREHDRMTKALRDAGWKYDAGNKTWHSPGDDPFTVVEEAYRALVQHPERYDARVRLKVLTANLKKAGAL